MTTQAAAPIPSPKAAPVTPSSADLPKVASQTKGRASEKASSTDLLGAFDRISDSIRRRAFELFEGNGCWPGNEVADWLQAEAELLHPVSLELEELTDQVTLKAKVPGFAAEDLEITATPHCVKIAGKRQAKAKPGTGQATQSGWSADQVLQAVELATAMDPSKATATLKDGVLTVSLPKAVPAKAVRLEAKTI